MTGPLEGVRVVSIEQAVAAPLCTRHLAELGASVIKIENPPKGDFAGLRQLRSGYLSALCLAEWRQAERRN